MWSFCGEAVFHEFKRFRIFEKLMSAEIFERIEINEFVFGQYFPFLNLSRVFNWKDPNFLRSRLWYSQCQHHCYHFSSTCIMFMWFFVNYMLCLVNDCSRVIPKSARTCSSWRQVLLVLQRRRVHWYWYFSRQGYVDSWMEFKYWSHCIKLHSPNICF